MSAGKHTPGPTREQMLALSTQGYAVREVWLGNYYDGLSAKKRVGQHTVEVFAGGANNGEPGDLHYAPVVYVDDHRVAALGSVQRAARVAAFRALMLAKATGAAS